ncbi:MAG TPA: radical SAM protein, partial [Deltaproteobacteria bacterium]|nr:radical SAM protein [Deltaproteobacteria bacterium]
MDHVKHWSYIFGPVPSRRLGRSLGIDLVPFKTCTFDCVYCQLGRTTNKTVERREWVPLQRVLEELCRKLASKPDYITLSGSGEPTLYSRIAELIEEIHSITDIPVAVLTNGSLLWKKEVRHELLNADLVLPSLDAGDKILFRKINRPHPVITYERLLDGLTAFREEFHGKYWLEVFLLNGHTSIDTEVKKIAKQTRDIGPDLVQLNTCVRPVVEDFARPVPWQRLVELANLFTPPAEVVVNRDTGSFPRGSTCDKHDILQLLQRRPCTSRDIADGLGIHPAEALKAIEILMWEGLVEARMVDPEHIHYVITPSVSADAERERKNKDIDPSSKLT